MRYEDILRQDFVSDITNFGKNVKERLILLQIL